MPDSYSKLMLQNKKEAESKDPEDRYLPWGKPKVIPKKEAILTPGQQAKWERERGGHQTTYEEQKYINLLNGDYNLNSIKSTYEENLEAIKTGVYDYSKYKDGSDVRELSPEEINTLKLTNVRLRDEYNFYATGHNEIEAARRKDGRSEHSDIIRYGAGYGIPPEKEGKNETAVREEYAQKRKNIKDRVTEQEQQQFKLKEDYLTEVTQQFDSLTRSQQAEVVRNFEENILPQSKYWRKYKDTDKLILIYGDKKQLALNYIATQAVYGDQGAVNTLDRELQDIVGHNQDALEQFTYGAGGIVTSALSMLGEGVGMLWGLLLYEEELITNWDAIMGPNGYGFWRSLLDSVFNNEVYRYAMNIEQYGTLILREQRRIQENGDLGFLNIVKTLDEEDSLWNAASMAEIVKSQGFTIASTILSIVTSGGVIGLGRAAARQAVKKLASQGFRQVAKNLMRIKKIEKYAQLAVPGIIGTIEGVQNGAQTYDFVMEAGEEMLKSQLADVADRTINSDRFTTTTIPNPGEEGGYTTVYKDNSTGQVYNSYEEAYTGMLEELTNDSKYKDSLEHIKADALTAAGNDIAINSVINGLSNTFLQYNLEASGVRKSIRELMTFTNTGKRTVGKKLWEGVEEAGGEFIEEYLQNVSSDTQAAAAEHNIYSFIDNKYNGLGNIAIGSYIAGDWAAAWRAFNSSITSKESLDAGISGALGSVFGTPATIRRNSQGTWGRGENESRFEQFLRYVPWRSGLFGGFYNNDNETDPKEIVANHFAKWLKDPKNKAKYDTLSGTISWVAQMDKEAAEGNEYGFRNSAMGKLINDAVGLLSQEGSDQYNEVITALQEAMNLEEGSDAANNAIERLRNQDKEGTKETSDAELLDRIKSNSKKMFDTIMEVKAASKEVDKLFGEDIDLDLKQTLIYTNLQRKDWEHRKQQLEDDLGSAFSSIKPSREGSTLTREQKNIIARYGTLANAIRVKQNLEKKIAELSKSKNKITKPILEKLRAQLAELQVIEQLDGGKDYILNEQDILGLDEFERGLFINGNYLDENGQIVHTKDKDGKITKAKSKISSTQQEVINNLIKQGEDALNAQRKEGETEKEAQHHEDFAKKMIDLGVMTRDIKTFYEKYLETLRDPNSIKGYIAKAKQGQQMAIAYHQAQQLSGIQDYKEWRKQLKAFGSNHDVIIGILAKQGDVNALRYIEHQNDMAQKEHFLNVVEEYDDANLQQELLYAFEYLNENDVDINDKDAVIQLFTENDEGGRNKFRQFIEGYEQGLKAKDKTYIESPEQIIAALNKFIKDYATIETEKARLKKEIEINPTTSEDNLPPAQNDAASQEKKVETPKSTTDQEVVTRATQSSGKEIGETVAKLQEMITKSTTLTPETKDNLKRVLSSMTSSIFQTKEDFIKQFERAAIAFAKVNPDKSVVLAAFQLAREYKVGLQRQQAKKDYEGKRYNSLQMSESTPETASINIAYIRAHYPDSPLITYYDEHHIEAALNDGILDGDPEILFITDSQLTEDVKRQMAKQHEEDPNLYPEYKEEIDLPIIAVVESKTGSVEINGKHYQPVAIMPETARKGSPGSENMNIVREAMNAKAEGVSIVQKDGKPLKTRKIIITTNGEQQLHTSTSRPVVEVAEKSMSPEEIAEMQQLPPEERKKSVAYKKARKRFLSRLSVVKVPIEGTNRFKYVFKYAIPNPQNKGQSETANVHMARLNQTKGSLGKTLIEIFRDPQRTVGQVIDFNSRTKHVHELMTKFIEHLYDTDGNFIGTQKQYDDFTKFVGRYLYVPTGYSYKVVNDQILLQSSYTGQTIVLTDIKPGMTEGDIKVATARFFNNLVMEGDHQRVIGGREFMTWNNSALDFTSDHPRAKQMVQELYDDGILMIYADRLEKGVDTVLFQTPGTEVAKPKAPVTPQETGEGGIEGTVDTTTGKSVEEASPKPVATENPVKTKIKETLDKLNNLFSKVVKSAEGFVLGDKTYTDNSKLPDSRLKQVSTGIQTALLDFFNGKLTPKSTYENVPVFALKRAIGSFTFLKSNIEEAGLNIIPNSISIVGTLEEGNDVGSSISFMVHDDKGTISSVTIAYYVGENFTLDSHTIQDVTAQRKLLSQNGVNVANTYVLPIRVDFNKEGGLRFMESHEELMIVQEQETTPMKPVRATPIPAEKQWKNLSKETKQALVAEDPELTAEIWETFSDEEMEQRLDCCG